MDPFVLLAAVRARKALFLLVLAGTVALAAAICQWLPKTYRATVALLVSESVATQADIVTSENVARRVIAALGLAGDAEARAEYERSPRAGPFEDWLVTEWLAQPKVALSQGNVLRIQVEHRTAVDAARLANAYSAAYLDLVRELATTSTGRAEAVLDSRLSTLRSDLREAQEQLAVYRRQHGILSNDASGDVRSARLADLSTQLSRVKEQNLELATRQQQVRQLHDQGGALDRLHEVQTDSQVQRLSAELQQGEASLQELAQQYGTAHPSYQRQVAENERRRAALDGQMGKVMAGIDNSLAQGRRRAAELEAEMASHRSRLLAAKSEQGELARLVHNAESAQRTYDTAVERFVVDMVGKEVFRSQASLLSAATVPLEPSSPRTGRVMAGAVFGGLLLALAVVFLLERLDRRVRTTADLGSLTDEEPLPVLGVITRWTPPRRLPALRSGAAPALSLQSR